MNKAFTKETDDAPPAPPEERPVSSALNLVTPRGAHLIKEQIAIHENKLATETDPHSKSELRRDLRYWLARQSSMQVVTPRKYTNIIGFGSQVTIQRGSAKISITIVGEDEAEPKAGFIAWTAPLARALDGAKVGAEVELDVRGGETVIVLAIAEPNESGT